MITVVSGFSPSGYEQYGRRMVESFVQHWRDARLIVYIEQAHALPIEVEQRPMPAACLEFLNRHRSNPFADGRRQKPGCPWKNKDVQKGYNFRFDAMKFCRMAMFAGDAASKIRDGILVWLDGDCVVEKDIPPVWVDTLLDGHDLAYLGRSPYHSETGFVAFRLPQAKAIAEGWGRVYATDEVFALREYHSAYVFDVVRERHPAIRARNLTPGGKKHVFFQCEVGDYITHLKGERPKALGHVPADKRAASVK